MNNGEDSEVLAIYSETKSLEVEKLDAICKQLQQLNKHNQELNEYNVELLNEVKTLRKRLEGIITRAFISASIILGLFKVYPIV